MSASRERPTTAADGDDITLSAAGDHVKGEFRCAGCGYGLAVCRELPLCPICGGESWRTGSWRPFGRALETSTTNAS